jgi:hypothetical protein
VGTPAAVCFASFASCLLVIVLRYRRTCRIVCCERNGVSYCSKLLGSAMEEEFEEGTTRTLKQAYLYRDTDTGCKRRETLSRNRQSGRCPLIWRSFPQKLVSIPRLGITTLFASHRLTLNSSILHRPTSPASLDEPVSSATGSPPPAQLVDIMRAHITCFAD